MNSIDTIKQYFQTDDRPTQAQFYEFFESIFWRDTGLAEKSVFATAGTIVIPAEIMLETIVFWTDTNQNLKVGDTAGSNEYEDVELTANVPYSLNLGLFSIAGQTIHLTGGDPANINFKYYLK